jgi:hypothetical protein
MFDRVTRLAERTATSLSRRGFLTRLGGIGLGALAFAAFVGEAAGKRKPPPLSCILNGGCCGGAFPYQKELFPGKYACASDATCSRWYLCAPSTCCNGSGGCANGVTCYSGNFCNALC